MSTYETATAHYLSPRRRDPVKVGVEEPVTHGIFAHAVEALDLPPGHVLRVLDVGSGTGDGLALLTEEHAGRAPVTAGYGLDYLGLDADPAMVATARSLHDGPGVAFAAGDVRDREFSGGFDVYLSCGVPYSHLTRDELVAALTGLLRGVAADGRHASVVVDVLGRYSVEWAPRWSLTSWDYAMSFLEDTDAHVEQPMTFYDRPALAAVVDSALGAAGVRTAATTFTDRSVLVGRHTATRTFNPGIPAYRTLLNDLVRSAGGVRTADLRFTPPTAGAPAAVIGFFTDWARRWNAIVDTAGPVDAPPAGDRAAALAADLFALERTGAPGLGVGHSLTATVVVEP